MQTLPISPKLACESAHRRITGGKSAKNTKSVRSRIKPIADQAFGELLIARFDIGLDKTAEDEMGVCQ